MLQMAFTSGFPTKISNIFIFFPTHGACPSHCILPNLIRLRLMCCTVRDCCGVGREVGVCDVAGNIQLVPRIKHTLGYTDLLFNVL